MSDFADRLRAARAVRVQNAVAVVPVWVWLTMIAACSTIARTIIGRRSPAPWIFDDELIYAKLAQSFASSGSFAVRGVHGLLGYGPGYPLLIAPAYAVFGDAAHAYAAAKGLNSLLMSLSAVPAYLIARRVLGTSLSLVAAGLAVVIPSLAYTSVIMTENAFYPASLLVVLAFVGVLERPTVIRQVGAFAAVGLAYLVRAQAVAFIPTLVAAIVIYALLEARAAGDGFRARPLLRRLDAFRVTWLVLVVGAVLVVAGQSARGKPVSSLLGAYSVLTSWHYSFGRLARWVFYHLAEIDLYVGVIPLAAFLVLCVVAWRSGLDAGARAFVAVSVPFTLFLALSASVLSSQLEVLNGIGRIEERNDFYSAPLFLIALVVWADRGLGRYRITSLVCAAVAAALPGFLPFARFVNLGALSDTLAFIPFSRLETGGAISSGHVRTLVVVVAVAAGLLFVLLPRRLAFVAPVLVLAYLLTWQTSLNRQIRGTSNGVLAASIGNRREWIDERAGRNTDVAALWTGAVTPLQIEEPEFFNRSVDRVYALEGAPPMGAQLPEVPTTTEPGTGVLLGPGNQPVVVPYVLADSSTTPQGKPLQSDPHSGLTLFRTFGV
ncbi:MAG TPA: glycosyltransferase family 39 protein, partial [Gaiellaceae bacterium]|nr:glycosyltransferase family 39 protein [Gaiellaceae bacterium]